MIVRGYCMPGNGTFVYRPYDHYDRCAIVIKVFAFGIITAVLDKLYFMPNQNQYVYTNSNNRNC